MELSCNQFFDEVSRTLNKEMINCDNLAQTFGAMINLISQKDATHEIFYKHACIFFGIIT